MANNTKTSSSTRTTNGEPNTQKEQAKSKSKGDSISPGKMAWSEEHISCCGKQSYLSDFLWGLRLSFTKLKSNKSAAIIVDIKIQQFFMKLSGISWRLYIYTFLRTHKTQSVSPAVAFSAADNSRASLEYRAIRCLKKLSVNILQLLLHFHGELPANL